MGPESAAPEQSPCAEDTEGCKRPEDCVEGTPTQYDCVIDDKTGIGRCVPLLDSCAQLQCEGDYVCQPATPWQESAYCVLDCRITGFCSPTSELTDNTAGDGYYCQRETGLCVLCDDPDGCTGRQTPWWYDCAMTCQQVCSYGGLDLGPECSTCLERNYCEGCLDDDACMSCLTGGQC